MLPALSCTGEKTPGPGAPPRSVRAAASAQASPHRRLGMAAGIARSDSSGRRRNSLAATQSSTSLSIPFFLRAKKAPQ
eukprot:3147400-Lingulodinium_polyedra.AAC.1